MEKFDQTSDGIEKHEEFTGWHKEVLQDLLKRISVEIELFGKGNSGFCKRY
jgi:hypothetical protein